ncbi:SLC13 family permease [Tepidanaerobacter sp. GT38]|uniref:SLC13 family permease n=1 Tax=Tepidanaerobacter sp. GT38 TaxID=2722793 RepID=UPI001F3B1CD6|nr:SLC13 family permease [Tepidanaerobacter sp. GT38]MCG1013167.1 SLC13 family permease [Tepidanaerobacter sp. GT38]
MISLIVVGAIVLSIALGFKTKINIGFFAMAFSYIIGCFMLNLKTSEIINMWPLSVFFVIFAVSIFYNFAVENGTLEKLSQYLLYSIRRVPHLLPYALFLSATILAALGAGYFTVLAFFAPITLLLCEKTGINKLIGAMSVNYGCLAGANFMTSASGIIFKGLVEKAGYTENVYSYTTPIFVATMIIPIVVITVFVFFSKSGRTSRTDLDIAKPEPFNNEQRITMFLIIAMILIVLAAPIAKLLLPNNETIALINSKIDIGLIAIVFSAIALLLRLGNEKKVVANVPWNTLIMICGVGMLISVAVKAGTVDLLAGWVGTNVPSTLVPIVMCIIGGIMSLFSSTLGVVAPTLFPTVPSISAATGINPVVLFVAIIVGAQATSISPFSSGGSLVLGSVNEREKDEMFRKLLFNGAPIALLASTLFTILLTMIM